MENSSPLLYTFSPGCHRGGITSLTDSKEAVITYRLQRARESLEEACMMVDSRHYNAALNRLYYSCFYAVSALLSSRNLSSVKHTGVRALFGQHFIKTGLVSQDLGALYNDLFEYRQQSDYEDFFRAEPPLLSAMLSQAEQFIEVIGKLAFSD